MDNFLTIYTIYKSPSDFPGDYVVKKWIIKKGRVCQDPSYIFLSKNLRDCQRQMVQLGLIRFSRNPDDDPVIVESWL